MHPFAEGTAAAALANLTDACASIEAALRARTDGGAIALMVQAQRQAINAREKLRDALTLAEMAVTTGEEED